MAAVAHRPSPNFGIQAELAMASEGASAAAKQSPLQT
jgi:hypothetical protein